MQADYVAPMPLKAPSQGLGPRLTFFIVELICSVLPRRTGVRMLRKLFVPKAAPGDRFQLDRERVEQHAVVRIPLPGLPDAALTIFSPRTMPASLPLVF